MYTNRLFDQVNWEEVRASAFTYIRAQFSLRTLIRLNMRGNYTPVSGDTLAKWRRDNYV